jgi:hypothetical protein
MLRDLVAHLTSPICGCGPDEREIYRSISVNTTVTLTLKCKKCETTVTYSNLKMTIVYDRDDAVSTRKQVENEMKERLECHDRDEARMTKLDSLLEKLKQEK